MRFIDEWRAGKTTIKQAMSAKNDEKTPPGTASEVEKQFMKKVERELALPDYSLFSTSSSFHSLIKSVADWIS